MLDQALADALNGVAPAQAMQPQTYHDPRVDQLLAARQAEVQQAADQAIDAIRGEEFFEDVKDDFDASQALKEMADRLATPAALWRPKAEADAQRKQRQQMQQAEQR